MLIFRYPWFIYSFLVPCYGSLQPGFSQLQRGHRLDRKLIQSFTELSFLDCVIKCLVTPRCKSVNYFKGANFCELNYENKTTAETMYMDNAGWVYSEKEHWPKGLAGACSHSNCQFNETCKHKRYSEDKFFECVLSDCGIPDLKGIDLNTTRREDAIGIHRRIHASCADGYSQSGSGRLNCQSNGEWKYDIVCEDMNQCLDNPCQNGGTFTQKDGCFTCSCTDGWTGARCNEAVSNLALNKPAKQSSRFTGAGVTYYANLAVDGNNGTDFVVDKCSSTAGGDTNPWWLVDLQNVYFVKSVRIFNRGMDKNGKDESDRLRNVTVTVGLTESDVNTPCGFFAGPGTLSQLAVIDCPTLSQGRFVKISIITEYLTLCEVEVFGYSV
ncbi:neurogenic locus notch homolog protein 2-like [Crassostrea angulata]|uniref:neurogenic locus notch homolog protein 2-like n=1 Tax=Magallana angulata TaxID=2784310 RepID=UPI0022B08A42|nr:neurogenic locus notch homolog protein 2-like [Crassostrea angulata]